MLERYVPTHRDRNHLGSISQLSVSVVVLMGSTPSIERTDKWPSPLPEISVLEIPNESHKRSCPAFHDGTSEPKRQRSRIDPAADSGLAHVDDGCVDDPRYDESDINSLMASRPDLQSFHEIVKSVLNQLRQALEAEREQDILIQKLEYRTLWLSSRSRRLISASKAHVAVWIVLAIRFE